MVGRVNCYSKLSKKAINMADIKLFKVGQKVEELKSSAVELEKKLQTLIEKNMDRFFNVQFLALVSI